MNRSDGIERGAEVLDKAILLERDHASHHDKCEVLNTDLANVDRLMRLHGQDLAYVPEIGWFVYDGRHYVRSNELAMEKIKDSARRIPYEIPGVSPDKQGALLKWAQTSQRYERISAVRNLAQSDPDILAKISDFDADPYLFNCENGTIDLRNGELRPHRREDMCSRIVNIPYQKEADCPQWKAFVHRAMGGNENMINFVQRAAGYSLTGLITEQVFFFCYGHGANGKSVFLETLGKLTGMYGLSAAADTFMHREHPGVSNDLARLAGARFVAVNELADGQRFYESRLKDITGGDTLLARFLHREFFEFKPTCKLWLRGNHKPQIRGTDHGIWRRVLLILFNVQIPEEERDQNLLQKLWAEFPGILNWALQGCLSWQEIGLNPPEEVTRAVQRYRSDMDILGAFIVDRCIVLDGVTCQAKELYNEYCKWCDENGHRAQSNARFGTALGERGFEKEKSGTVKYFGISLKWLVKSDHDLSITPLCTHCHGEGCKWCA